jgi:hypothetical protein
VQILNLYRWAFMGTAIDPLRLAESVLISVALLIFGFRFFRANELEYGRR